ncbi:tectonin beta-propeller repeat-containing protein 2-like isoform x2 [Plakobranchus ocellatus]|uniref:Tectonin beta-propeller repeat-containing protein 2-like isoform x2 n=1 Tax=Plakobranchus ocellatus TaxID=259542 RepID=A0AAV4BD70_9GAST|nr:tectonin beta-propeller repeat-containing protein 2-like isoform x2 [Plakobranchus ocellatus]
MALSQRFNQLIVINYHRAGFFFTCGHFLPFIDRCLGCQGRLSGVVDVAVVPQTDEIFLLRRHADARVIRIAKAPEAKEHERTSVTSSQETDPASAPAPGLAPGPALGLASVLTSVLASAPVSGVVAKDGTTNPEHEQKAETSGMSFFKRLGFYKEEIKPAIQKEEEESQQDLTSAPEVLPPVVEISPSGLDDLRLFTSQNKVVTNNPSSECVSNEDKTDSTLGVKSPSASTGDNSIVFSHRMKRNRRKKQREVTVKSKECDMDTVSQESFESGYSFSISTEEESTVNTLKEADSVLNLVRNIIAKENQAKSGKLPDVLPSGDRTAPPCDKPDIVEAKPGSNVSDGVRDIRASDVVSAPSKENSQSVLPKSEKKTESSQNEKVLSSSENSLEKVPKKVEKNVLENSIKVTKPEASSPSKNPQKKGSSNQPSNGDLLSEVDQHIKVIPQPEDAVSSENPSAKISQHDLHMVDSVLERICGPEQGKTENVEDNVAESDDGSASVSTQDKEKKLSLDTQQSVSDVYSELNSLEGSEILKRRDSTETDDFYSKYLDATPASPDSSAPTFTFPASDAASLTHLYAQDTKKTTSHLANSWSEYTAPANIYSLAVSDNHVWFTDKRQNIYYSSLHGEKGIVWRKATGYASQISVSPSGLIVWRLYKGVVYAGTKISTRHPEGLKWVEAVRDVQYISVSNNCAWFIKNTGELMLQQGLSKERPCYRSREVGCGQYCIKKITCNGQGVVWAITEGLQLLVRTGVTYDFPAGDAWEACIRESPPYLFSHVAIDRENTGWAIDITGQFWFCTGVTQATPKGTSAWFQVPMSGYVMQDSSMLDMIRSAAHRFDPTKLSYITSANRGGFVTAGSQGIWLSMDFQNLLQNFRGTIQGYHWIEAQPAQMSPATQWKHVCASISHLEWGPVWAQHLKQDMFIFKRARKEAHTISDCGNLVSMAVAPNAVWTLSHTGEVRIRYGMGSHCLMGADWATLDLSQLGKAQLVHLSCNASYVWAVDTKGRVYQRIGVSPPSETNLNPVWLPLQHHGDVLFTKVFVGPLDWMVWSIDSRWLCFVRIGITESMPIGKEWIHVSGIQVADIAITKTGVWALSTQGEVFFRYGISLHNRGGDYWKKIPGIMAKISASENDKLWGINPDGQLMRCKFKILPGKDKSTEASSAKSLTREMSVYDDWELV